MSTTVRLGVGMAAAMLLASVLIVLLSGTGRAGAQEPGVYEACRPSKDVVDTSGLPATVEEDRCPVEGRELVSEDGVTLAFPEAGQGIALSTLNSDGSEQDFEVVNLPGDTFRIEEHSDNLARSRAGLEQRNRPNGCSSGAYSLTGWKVFGTLGFTINGRSIPSYLNDKAAITDIRRGGAHITNVHNPCGIGDGVGAKILYKGQTRSQTDAHISGCSSGDGRSVVGFGPLRDAVARACTYFSSSSGFDRVTSSDIRFNTNKRFFTSLSGGCSTAHSLEGVATHERGHTFGLGHTSSLGQTMYSISPRCSNSLASLGRGDSLGLNRIY